MTCTDSGFDEEVQGLETVPLEVFRLDAELLTRASLDLARWLVARR